MPNALIQETPPDQLKKELEETLVEDKGMGGPALVLLTCEAERRLNITERAREALAQL